MSTSDPTTPETTTGTTTNRNILIAAVSVLLVIAIAGAAWFFLLREEPYEFQYGFYEPAEAAPMFEGAVDQHGEPFTMEEHDGKLLFVYFGYTHCPDACPATLDEFMEVKEFLGEEADNVEFIMVTVDPERDTPERMAEYLGFWDPEFIGLVMPEEQTEEVARAWNVQYTYREANSQGGYLVDHEVSSFVIDTDGMKRLTYPLGADTEVMAEDAEHLLSEE